MVVLGINSVYHETAAAIVVNGELVAAIEEERLNRRTHGKQALVGNPHEIPALAIEYCLQRAGVSPSDIDAVAYSFDPKLRLANFVLDK
jgi:carbamoyltransferase